MKNMKNTALAAAAACLVALPVYADSGLNLDNLDLGASVRVRGNNIDFDDAASDLSFVEQRTRINFGMNVDDAVQTMIELASYDTWGEDFQSDPILGDKSRADSSDDIEVYQAWFEVGGDAGTLRVGRQEMTFGSEWLVGNGDNEMLFRGLSFDGFRATKGMGDLTLDLFAMKVAEGFDSFGDNDTDFSGVYASYAVDDNTTLDAYWMWLRDDGNFSTSLGAIDADYHTIGGRVDTMLGGLNLETELAYQAGSAEVGGGAADLDVAALGVNVLLGYGLDMGWSPYLFYNMGYFQGASNDELAFNRLFSDYSYTQYDFEENFSNHFAHVFGVELTPCEAVDVGASITYMLVDEEVGADDDIGMELHLWSNYQYSEHLAFRGGWAMLEGGDALTNGELIAQNGTQALGGNDDSTFHYLYLESELTF